MYDPSADVVRAIGSGSPAAVALVWLGGALSSVGPCTAPRMIAVVSLGGNGDARMRLRTVAIFIAGLMTAYGSFGVFASLLGMLSDLTHWVYVAVAGALGFAGIWTLARANHDRACTISRPRSLGSVFLLGAGFALVISPCCTPILIAVLSYCAQTRNVAYAVLLLAVFAMGHSLPLFLVGSAADRCARIASRLALSQGVEVVAGALMICLAGYYLCVA